MYLLDVNVLIALIDPSHIHHDSAHEWFASIERWATCAITENGVLRILGNPNYPNSPGPPAIVATYLADLKKLPGYEFWTEAMSILDKNHFKPHRISSPKQITDSYLLGLAVRHGGLLATFDRNLSTDAVIGGENALHVIGS